MSTSAAQQNPATIFGLLLQPDQYDFWARQLGSIDAWSRCFARVMAVSRTPNGDAQLVLKPNRHFRKFVDFGRCELIAEIDGRNRARTYDVAKEAGRLLIHVAADSSDEINRHLLAHVRRGDVVELREAGSAPVATAAPGADAAVADQDTVTIYLRSSDQYISAPRDASLLEALEAAGLQPKFGCRKGICNRCSCTRVSGETIDMTSGDHSDAPEQPLRICVSRAAGDLELDL